MGHTVVTVDNSFARVAVGNQVNFSWLRRIFGPDQALAITVDTDVDLGGAGGTISGLDRVLEGFHLANTGAVGVVWRVSELAICTNSQCAVLTFKRRCTVGTHLFPIDMGHFGAFASSVVIEHIAAYRSGRVRASLSVVVERCRAFHLGGSQDTQTTHSRNHLVLAWRQVIDGELGFATEDANDIDQATGARFLKHLPVAVLILDTQLNLDVIEHANRRTRRNADFAGSSLALSYREAKARSTIKEGIPQTTDINN